ncbi:hypothetical protein ACYULU_06090 [Breznakiellaceae bacterium SP9]
MIIALAGFWYGLVPVIGACIKRYQWRLFRQRFEYLGLKPELQYARYNSGKSAEGEYRFVGVLESISDEQILWVRTTKLLVPIRISGAQTYSITASGTSDEWVDRDEEDLQRIKWSEISSFTGEVKVFAGGPLLFAQGRLTFRSAKNKPLLIIFFTGDSRDLTIQVLRSGRQKNEYWNMVTPYSFILGAFSIIILASSLFLRPAFRLAAITAFISLFSPVLTLVPPGLLCTVAYRRLRQRARIYRSYHDIVRLPLIYPVAAPANTYTLPNGERYCVRPLKVLGRQPLLIPKDEKKPRDRWYICGAVTQNAAILKRPKDIFAVYGAIPGDPEILAKRFVHKAYFLEFLSVCMLIFGLALNFFFIAILLQFYY